jgi:parvulin-like peptidyl-prolyl isomerase
MSQSKGRQGRGWTSGLLVAGLLAGAAYGQAPSGPVLSSVPAASASAPDKVVLKVGDAFLTEGEIERLIGSMNPQSRQNLAQQGRRPLGDRLAMTLALSQEALSRHLDSAPAYQELMARARREVLATLAYQEMVREAAVTADEVGKYYAAHQKEYEGAQIDQISVRKKAADAKPGTPGFTPEEAKTRIEEIRKAFLAGDDPKQVAEKYQLPNVIRVDGEPHLLRRGQMRQDMDQAVFQLKDGQVSEVFDAGQSLAFFKLVSHDVERLVAPQIEATLRQQKVTSALDEIKKNAKIWMDDAYFAAPTPPAAPAAAPSAAKPAATPTPAAGTAPPK